MHEAVICVLKACKLLHLLELMYCAYMSFVVHVHVLMSSEYTGVFFFFIFFFFLL